MNIDAAKKMVLKLQPYAAAKFEYFEWRIRWPDGQSYTHGTEDSAWAEAYRMLGSPEIFEHGETDLLALRVATAATLMAALLPPMNGASELAMDTALYRARTLAITQADLLISEAEAKVSTDLSRAS